MKTINIINVVFFLFYSSIILGQQKQKKSQSIFNRISLRKSFQSTNSTAEPATITYTKSKGKSSSWLLDAAIGVDLTPRDSIKAISLTSYFEYHKNTLINEEQNNWLTGLALEWLIFDIQKKNWTPILISSIKYNKDNFNDVSSFQGSYYFTTIFKRKSNLKYFWIPNNIVNIGKSIQFNYTPYFGIENENRISTNQDSNNGSIYRAYFRVTPYLSIFKSYKKLNKLFDITADWQYRYNLYENVSSLNRKNHKFFFISANYIFFSNNDGNKTAKIGLDYTNGGNPTIGFKEQSFYAVSLKVQL
ncbi:hypothetical protein SAMN04487765_3474 [Tenacibaculum sp. MAR_2010_89]|uniref:hypothetical protein n=1 Tax=Tenacibaculum sp. MAR_2010_89 TaxID=1250198 RepID=UPI00089D601D|nr:hypothetical protein [Tenacibaculum sp. MAR_2010_89]SEE63033.1 hypothetical protein SAMN04487765_3474 [Tenacibaculum sp. MAR_2010_89]